MKRFYALVTLLFCAAITYAQTSTITATVVDSDSQAWNNGTWILTFKVNPIYPVISQYNINGTPLSSSVIQQTGSMNGSGVLSFNAYNNPAITPQGSSWQLQVCPLATSACGTYNFTISTNTDISAAVNAIIKAPRFSATAGSYGYLDVEAITTIPIGGTYYNYTLSCQRYYSGSSWACGSGGGGGPITGVLAGTGLNGGGSSGIVTLNLDNALPNGETATTQTTGDTTTKVATDQFVANAITAVSDPLSGQTPGCLPLANSTTTSTSSSSVCDNGTAVSTPEVVQAPGFQGTGSLPGYTELVAGTGNIPALPANSAGWAAPTTGGTPYLLQPPSTITAGILHAAAPGVVNNVNQSAVSSGAVNLASSDVTGLLPNGNLAHPSTTVNGQVCTLGSTCTIAAGASSTTVPLIRGSTSAQSATGAVNVTLPSGSTSGDFAVLFVSATTNVTTPSGWTAINGLNSVTWNTMAFYKTLSSGDITNGYIATSGSSTALIQSELVVYAGATGGIRESQFDAIAALPQTLTTDSAVTNSDSGLFYITDSEVSAGTNTQGVILTQSGTGLLLQNQNLIYPGYNATSTLGTQTMPGGTFATTFNFTPVSGATPNVMQVIVEGVQATSLLPVSTSTSGCTGNFCPITQQVSGLTNVYFNNCINPAASTYQFRFENVVISASTDIYVQFSTNYGAGWDTSSTYSYNTMYQYANATGGPSQNWVGNASSTSGFKLLAGSGAFPTAATDPLSGVVTFHSPLSTTNYKQGDGILNTGAYGLWATYRYQTANAINAVQFLVNSGTFTSGTITCQPIAQ